MSISTCSLTYVVGSIMFFVGVGIGLPQLLSSPTMTADLHGISDSYDRIHHSKAYGHKDKWNTKNTI